MGTVCLEPYAVDGCDTGHAVLRQQVASHIEASGVLLSGLLDTSPDDGKTFRDHIAALRNNGVEAGQDAILAISEVCQREVHVYMAYMQPEKYCPSNGVVSGEPIRIAFYEPGHYRAVVSAGNCQYVTSIMH
jgi:hypothetical protein